MKTEDWLYIENERGVRVVLTEAESRELYKKLQCRFGVEPERIYVPHTYEPYPTSPWTTPYQPSITYTYVRSTTEPSPAPFTHTDLTSEQV